MAQENLIKASGIPYTIVRSTQFFEFIGRIVESGVDGDVIRLSPALLQPIASDDVAAAMADARARRTGERHDRDRRSRAMPLDKLARKLLSANGDRREVIADVHARYYGTELNDRSLTPGDHPRLGSMRFEDWLSRHSARR